MQHDDFDFGLVTDRDMVASGADQNILIPSVNVAKQQQRRRLQPIPQHHHQQRHIPTLLTHCNPTHNMA
jgi:hypothetical protein